MKASPNIPSICLLSVGLGAQSRLTHQAEREQNDFQVSENPLHESHPSEADNNNDTHTGSREPPSYPRQAQEHIPHHGDDHPHPYHRLQDFHNGGRLGP